MDEKLPVLSGLVENVKQIENPLLAARQHRPTGTATTKIKITTQKGASGAHLCQCFDNIKARHQYAKRHLKVSRQREEFAKEKALGLIQSNDSIAYEDLYQVIFWLQPI
jgi:hypothetical protein